MQITPHAHIVIIPKHGWRHLGQCVVVCTGVERTTSKRTTQNVKMNKMKDCMENRIKMNEITDCENQTCNKNMI